MEKSKRLFVGLHFHLVVGCRSLTLDLPLDRRFFASVVLCCMCMMLENRLEPSRGVNVDRD